MIPVFLLEPSSLIKRRQFAKIFSEPKRPILPLVDEGRQRLKDIRQHSLNNLESLINQFQTNLTKNHQAQISVAANSEQMAQHMLHICGPTKTIAINNSSLISKELVPALLESGFAIAESYYQQFPSFQSQFQNYWQLPDLEFNVLNHALTPPIDLNQLRQRSMAQTGVRDFAALLGVGAASAEDGSIFLFQHGHNISDIFKQARKLILVIGLEKVTAGFEEAAFQTKCLALFGAETRLLDLQPSAKTGPAIDELPIHPASSAPDMVHVIIFDNGRRHILGSPFRQLITCINCRACIKNCPTYKYFGGAFHWSPKEYLYFFALNQNPSLDLCLQCGLCRRNCPLEIDIPGLIAFGRSRKRQPFVNKMLTNIETIGKLASLAPLRSTPPLITNPCAC